MRDRPTISVCIPQYGRSRYLLKVLESLREQSYPEVEVVVSDDCSKDDTAVVVPEYLSRSGMHYKFIKQEKNIGYDANLRAALNAATGDYLFILGNDDAVAYSDAMRDLADEIDSHGRPAVVLVNHRSYLDVDGKHQLKRVQKTALLPGGPETALKVYRSFSFVGGIAYRRDAFHEHDTSAFDTSIFVQVYLATRIVASGGSLLMLDRTLIAKDVVVDGQEANSYKDVLRATKTPVAPHSQGLASIASVAFKAILPYLSSSDRDRAMLQLYKPLLQYTYPYWLYAHRKESFYRAALSMSWGCYPSILLQELQPSLGVTVRLMPYYLASTVAGWIIPTAALGRLQRWGYNRSKRL